MGHARTQEVIGGSKGLGVRRNVLPARTSMLEKLCNARSLLEQAGKRFQGAAAGTAGFPAGHGMVPATPVNPPASMFAGNRARTAVIQPADALLRPAPPAVVRTLPHEAPGQLASSQLSRTLYCDVCCCIVASNAPWPVQAPATSRRQPGRQRRRRRRQRWGGGSAAQALHLHSPSFNAFVARL